MLDFAKKYGYNTYSQNGEDGIIEECLKRIYIAPTMFTRDHKAWNGVAVEFGAADGFFCSNTALLVNKKWNVFMYDINPKNPLVKHKIITTENVNELPKCNVLSIDIDGKDYEVWKAYKGKPDIVIIEINSSLNPSVEFYSPEQGASFMTMLKLGQDKGYFLLCHTGNLVFILNEHKKLFPEIDDIVTIDKFFNTSWL